MTPVLALSAPGAAVIAAEVAELISVAALAAAYRQLVAKTRERRGSKPPTARSRSATGTQIEAPESTRR